MNEAKPEMAMFGFLIALVLSILAVTILSATGAIAVYAIFGPNLSPRLQQLADTFVSVYSVGAAGFLGMLRLLRRDESVSNNRPQTQQAKPELCRQPNELGPD